MHEFSSGHFVKKFAYTFIDWRTGVIVDGFDEKA